MADALLSDADIGLGQPAGQRLPLGIRNNNPGNIRGQGGAFRQFGSMEEGVNASDDLLKTYGSKHKLDTVEGVISRWAPSTENDTQAYIRRVQQSGGFKPGEKIDLQDETTRGKLRDAMLDHESPGWRSHYTPGKDLLSDADLGLAPTPEKPSASEVSSGRLLARAGKDIAGLADMVASMPGGLLSTLGGLVEQTLSPVPMFKGEREQQVARQAAVREAIASKTTNPIAALMHLFGYEKDYQDSDVGKVTRKINDMIDKGSGYAEKQSGGAVTTQQLQMLAGDLMNLSPLGFTKFVRGARGEIPTGELKAGKVSDSTAASILKRYTDEHGNPEKLDVGSMKERLEKELTTKSDMEINAEAKAYDLMTRGASRNEVLKARKANPLVGQKLDEMMARRKGTMEGPLSTAMPIDAVLGPEAPKVRPQLEGPRESTGGPTTGDRPGMGGSATPPGQTPPRPELPGPRTGAGAGGRTMRGQRGGADPRALIGLAAVTGGATIGATLAGNDKLEGAILGGMGGLAATLLPKYASRVGDNWGRTLKLTATTAGLSTGLAMLDKDHPVEGALLGALWGASHMLPRARVPQVGHMTLDELVNTRNGAIAVQERQVANVSRAMRESVKDPARRVAVAEAVESGNLRGLSPTERQVAESYRGFTKSYGEAAKDVGVLKDLVTNYVTHVVERDALPRTKVQEVMDALFGDGQGSGAARATSGFAKARKYATFGELEKALEGTGLKIKTRDIADLVDIYGRSMTRAIENKRMFDSLKAAKEGGEGGRPFIQPTDKAPSSYVGIDNPQMQGMRVHPDIAPALRFVAEAYKPSYIMRGLMGVSMAQKRLATGMSLFHAQNLINAYAGASGLKTFRMVKDVNAALDTYYKGGLGDVIDEGLKAGLKIERPMETDLAAGKRLGQAVDNLVNGTLGTKFSAFEKGLGAVEKLQRETFDKLTWDYLHSGLKMALFTREFERGLLKHPDMPRAEVARQVASFVNDTFGGLDWYRVATETQSQLGRNLALSALNPKGRAALQILMFAPDWTMSTFRSMYKALPGSTAMPLTTRLHQKYVMRTALIWATLMNGYNMAASGHPIWDNKDPTKIEWKDGTTQQIAKHAMEGPEWLLHPRQTALNKLGMPVKEVMDQLTGKEYLSAEGPSPPMEGSRIGHLARSVSPLSLQTGGVPGREPGEVVKRSALSALGMPVYKMTKAEKEAAKRERERKRKHKTYGSKP